MQPDALGRCTATALTLLRIGRHPLVHPLLAQHQPRALAPRRPARPRRAQELHARGYVHRDIKPSNCLLAQSRYLKLSDLGLAKHLDAGAKAHSQVGDAARAAGSALLGGGTGDRALGHVLLPLGQGTAWQGAICSLALVCWSVYLNCCV